MTIQGVINGSFSHILTLERMEGPEHALQLITSYITDVEAILSELSSHKDGPETDFSMLAALVRKIEERSSSIGAEQVRLACLDLICAYEQRRQPIGIRALSWLRKEFDHTQRKLDAVIQMERRILRVESRQQNGASSSLILPQKK